MTAGPGSAGAVEARTGAGGARTGWTVAGTVDGRSVGRWTAVAGTVAAVPVVLWAFAVGGNASGAAGALAVFGVVVGAGTCVAGGQSGPPAAGVALAGAVLIALAGSQSAGVRLDAGPIATLAVAATELWGWSLDHRADLVTRDALLRRVRTLGVVTTLALGGSIAVPLLAGAGGGDLLVRAVAVAAVVAAVAVLVRAVGPLDR